ncbi:MAG TPA: AsmA family protein [Tepidisphaeraceae bacterium]|nr:AsmA family protein [Tepidisphaeraceae bacterium]
MRKIRRITGIVFLVTILMAVIAFMAADWIIGAAAQREATDSLGVATRVGAARLWLGGSRLSLRDVTIDNPPGYSNSQLLDLGDIDLAIPLWQLQSRPLHVRQIDFVSPHLLLERRNGKWNVQMLGHSSADPLRLFIDQVTVTGAVVTLRLNLTPGDKPMTVDVPTFTMDNIRASDGSGRGATIKDALLQITRAMTAKAISPAQLAQQIAPGLPLGLRLPMGEWLDPFSTLGLEAK